MQSWNHFDTHALVKSRFGPAQEALTRKSTLSVNHRKDFSSYHYAELIRLTKAFESRYMKNVSTILDMHTQDGTRIRQAFERYMVKAGAHTIGAAQSLHALPDIFAHAIYFATGQNLLANALPDRDINLPKVVATLKKSPSFNSLAPSLAGVQSGEGWKHLSAVCNMSKHRSVVRAALNEDWTGSREDMREIQVESFEHNSHSFPAMSVKDLLEPEYFRLLNSIVSIGNNLNSCLREIAA